MYRLTLEEVDLIIRVINNIRDLTLRAKLAGAASALVRQVPPFHFLLFSRSVFKGIHSSWSYY